MGVGIFLGLLVMAYYQLPKRQKPKPKPKAKPKPKPKTDWELVQYKVYENGVSSKVKTLQKRTITEEGIEFEIKRKANKATTNRQQMANDEKLRELLTGHRKGNYYHKNR